MSQADQAPQETPDTIQPQRPDAIGYWAILLSGIVFRYVRHVVSSYGYRPIQFLILDVCSRGEADTVTGIARIIPFDASAISRQVEVLRAKGLLRTRRSTVDRRVVHVELTQEGRTLVEELLEGVRAEGVRHMAVLSESEQKHVIALIRRVVESAEAR